MTAACAPAERPLGPDDRTRPTLPAATRHRVVAIVVALAVAGALVLLPAGAASAEPVSEWLSWANGVRASNGLPGLALDAELSGLAQQRAEINADNGSLAHTPSLRAGVTANWTKLGENVGLGPSVASIGGAFVNSPQHLHNLLDPSFDTIGIGVTVRGGTMYVTHRFMGTSSAPATASTPTPAAPPAPTPKPAPTTTAPRPAATTPPPTVAPAPPPPVAPTPPPAQPGRAAAVLDALRQLG
jgi:hypothetical protein